MSANETSRTRGGWTLQVTCPCGTTTTYEAVVPSLVADQADRNGWWVDGGPLARPREARDGLCGACQRAQPTRQAGAA